MADHGTLSKEELVDKARKGQLTQEQALQYLIKVRGYSRKDALYMMQPPRASVFTATDIDLD